MIILGTNSIKDTGFDVANSLRQNRADSSFLSKTFSTDGTHHDKGTLSVWLKRSEIGAESAVYTAGSSSRDFCRFESNDTLTFRNTSGHHLNTNRVFRDVSAFYNIVISFDSSQGTASNRVKFYVNGVQETSFATETYPSQNRDMKWFSAELQRLGADSEQNTPYANCYFCEVVGIDGQALTPTSFGEFDEDSGIWKPIDVSGLTFGTNGFHLDFEDSSALGNDVSGNNNDFANTNFAATDQSTDTCTNNFATLNSLINFNSGVFTEGNLAITYGDDTVSTIGLTSGRWYWEAQRTNTANEAHFGIGVSRGFFSATSVVSSGDRIYVRGGATFVSAVSNLSILTFGSNGGTPATVSNGDVIGFYLDLESSTKNITVKKNDGATPIIDIDLTYSGEEPIFPFCRMNSGCASSWNFGNPIAALSSANADANGFGSFEFNPTKGGVNYFAICTKNLAEFGG